MVKVLRPKAGQEQPTLSGEEDGPPYQDELEDSRDPQHNRSARGPSKDDAMAVEECWECGSPVIPPYCRHVACIWCPRSREYDYGCDWQNCCKRCNATFGVAHDAECDARNLRNGVVDEEPFTRPGGTGFTTQQVTDIMDDFTIPERRGADSAGADPAQLAKSWVNAFRRAAHEGGFDLDHLDSLNEPDSEPTNETFSLTIEKDVGPHRAAYIDDASNAWLSRNGEVLREDDWSEKCQALEELLIRAQQGDKDAIAAAQSQLADDGPEVRALAAQMVELEEKRKMIPESPPSEAPTGQHCCFFCKYEAGRPIGRIETIGACTLCGEQCCASHRALSVCYACLDIEVKSSPRGSPQQRKEAEKLETPLPATGASTPPGKGETGRAVGVAEAQRGAVPMKSHGDQDSRHHQTHFKTASREATRAVRIQPNRPTLAAPQQLTADPPTALPSSWSLSDEESANADAEDLLGRLCKAYLLKLPSASGRAQIVGSQVEALRSFTIQVLDECCSDLATSVAPTAACVRPARCACAFGCRYRSEYQQPWCLYCHPENNLPGGFCACPCETCYPDSDSTEEEKEEDHQGSNIKEDASPIATAAGPSEGSVSTRQCHYRCPWCDRYCTLSWPHGALHRCNCAGIGVTEQRQSAAHQKADANLLLCTPCTPPVTPAPTEAPRPRCLQHCEIGTWMEASYCSRQCRRATQHKGIHNCLKHAEPPCSSIAPHRAKQLSPTRRRRKRTKPLSYATTHPLSNARSREKPTALWAIPKGPKDARAVQDHRHRNPLLAAHPPTAAQYLQQNQGQTTQQTNQRIIQELEICLDLVASGQLDAARQRLTQRYAMIEEALNKQGF